MATWTKFHPVSDIDFYRDLEMDIVNQTTRKFVKSHDQRLIYRVNVHNTNEIRRLKRIKSSEQL